MHGRALLGQQVRLLIAFALARRDLPISNSLCGSMGWDPLHIQVGLANIINELPYLPPYPYVHEGSSLASSCSTFERVSHKLAIGVKAHSHAGQLESHKERVTLR